MCSRQSAPAQGGGWQGPGHLYKAGRAREPHLLDQSSEEPARPPGEQAHSMMMSPSFLSCLFLLLPLGTCLPLLDREEPTDAIGGTMSWADLARRHRGHFPWGSSEWLPVPHPHALLVTAKELQMSGRERAGFRFRFGRQDEGSEATGFFPADGDKASGPLGTLAEELNGYSRKKGGFSFRFGRR